MVKAMNTERIKRSVFSLPFFFALLCFFNNGIFAQDLLPPSSIEKSQISNSIPDQKNQSSNSISQSVRQFQKGDGIKIAAYPDTSGFPNGVYLIDSDGFADLPILGYINVLNKTPQQIEDLLLEKYSPYMAHLNISVRPVFRISLLGGFYRPGLYWINPRESLWKAVEHAGGTQREDGFRKIRWERDSKIFKKNIVPEIQSGASLYSIGFKSGDQLWVISRPRQQFWEMFRNEILPIVSLLITSASVYATYQVYTAR